MPGFGQAPPLPERRSSRPPPTWRAALHEQCAERGIERPHVAGNSLGGWVALEMGRSGWAASVTALSPAGLWRGPSGAAAGGGGRMLLRGSPCDKLARPLMTPALLVPATRRLAFQAIAAHPERIPPAAAASWSSAGSKARATTAPTGRCARTSSIPAGYPAGRAGDDRLVRARPPGRPAAAQRRPAGARFLVLPGVGHTPTWDDPELVARTLLEGSAVSAAA